jgi:purine-binding chemotaxis protein CheW
MEMQLYLVFSLGNSNFALNVIKLLNIVEYKLITKVPGTPDYIKGIINIRDEIIPVIDSMKILGLGEIELGEKSCILIFENKIETIDYKAGILVNSVYDVIKIKHKDLLQPPLTKYTKATEYISGIIRNKEDIIMILDINKLFNIKEVIAFNFYHDEKKPVGVYV